MERGTKTMKYHQDMKSRKKWLSGALVCIFLFFLVMVADYVIKGYYYPQKMILNQVVLDGSLKKEHRKLFCKRQISNRQKAENRKREET